MYEIFIHFIYPSSRLRKLLIIFSVFDNIKTMKYSSKNYCLLNILYELRSSEFQKCTL